MHHKPKHIVAIRLSAMGDVAMTVPVIRALMQQHTDVKLTIVSREFYRPFFNDIPNVCFFAFDDKNLHAGKKGIFRLFADIQSLKPDAFIDLHNVIRTKFLRFLFRFTHVKIAAIYKGRLSQKEITAPTNKIFRQTETVFEKQLKAYSQLGFTIDLTISVFPPKAKLTAEIKKEFGIARNMYTIGIAPFAQYQSKIYPIDLMQQVIDALDADPQYNILLFGGGEAEIVLLNRFCVDKSNTKVVAGKVSFQEEIDIISNLDVMLSMDSGNAHIGAMMGLPVVTLWGATHPYAGFNPFNQPAENAIVSDRDQYPMLPTSIYGNKIVDGYDDAMRTILPETIVSRIVTILKKSS